MLLPASDLVPFSDFETASRAALALLYERLGFNLWMMTRTDGLNWIVLQAEDHGYNVKDGMVFGWADSFCSQMVRGLGPRFAPCAQDIPSYAEAPIGQQVAIGAYIGVPIKNADGSLFGTLCAIDPTPKDEAMISSLPWIELIARMLGTILANELRAIDLSRQIVQAEQAAMLDPLTGLLNRNGWDQKLNKEEMRSRRYGSPICVWRIALTGEEDALKICNASQVLRECSKLGDVVAHFGGGEFALLCPECDAAQSEATTIKLNGAFAEKRMDVSIGTATRDPRKGLSEAMDEAHPLRLSLQ